MAIATSTVIAAVGLAVAAAGAGVSYYGTQQQAKASEKAEELRKKQVNLESYRRRRQILREMIVNQATARSNAAVQGVAGGDSAIQGAQAQQTSSAAMNINAVNQSQSISSGIFDANKAYAAGQVTSAWGGNIQSVGGAMFQNSEKIARVGASAGLWKDGY